MTQTAIIRALQNNSLTAQELEKVTGIPRTSILSACKKMLRKKELTFVKVKLGSYWVSKYTLEPCLIEATKADEPYDKLNPFDIRNAQGIFSKSEYAVMNAQARRLLGRPNEITNNQFI